MGRLVSHAFFPLSGVAQHFVPLVIISSVGRLQLELKYGFPTPRHGMKGKYPFPGGVAPLGPVAGRPSVAFGSRCHLSRGCVAQTLWVVLDLKFLTSVPFGTITCKTQKPFTSVLYPSTGRACTLSRTCVPWTLLRYIRSPATVPRGNVTRRK